MIARYSPDMNPTKPCPDRSKEWVCLVDEDNREVGFVEKSKVHRSNTPLHRAFSIFLFNDEGELLLQQRALHKVTWPGVWSNSCCGHPQPGELLATAAHRRLRQELNLAGGELHLAVHDFRYRASYMGVEENEICPVFIGRLNQRCFSFDPNEVCATSWITWDTFLRAATDPSTLSHSLRTTLPAFSPWSRWEAAQLSHTVPDLLAKISQLRPFSPILEEAV